MTEKKEVIKTEETQVMQAPSALIEKAISSGADLDKLEKLLDLQMKFEANEAKKAYVIAMAEFKADPPEIFKNKKVKFQTAKGITEYDYADLANVTKQLNSSLSKHGLSAAWETHQEESWVIAVTCKMTHDRGHSEQTTLKAPPDDTGSKNRIQSIGSTIAYLERYTLLALCGLATAEMDTDGVVKKEKEPITMPKAKEEKPRVAPPQQEITPTQEQQQLIPCQGCGKYNVTEEVYNYSMKHYNGKVYCRECQKKQRKSTGRYTKRV